MGLITLGYGHMTVITMGLGNSIRIVSQEPFRQIGRIEFENIIPKVKITDSFIETSFEDQEREIEYKDIDTEVKYD